MTRENIELRVRDILAQKGMTLTSLAEKMGISLQYASNIVNTKKSLSLNALLKLASALDVNFGDLFVSSYTPKAEEPEKDFEAVVKCKQGTFTANNVDALQGIVNMLSVRSSNALELMKHSLERLLRFPSERDYGLVSELIANISRCVNPDEWHTYYHGTISGLLPVGFEIDYKYLSSFMSKAELESLERSVR